MNEAWIFLAIGDAGGCDRLVGREALLDMADAINHSLPTAEELASALASLDRAGLAAVVGDDCALTERGCGLYLKVCEPPRGHIARFLALDEEWSRKFPPDAFPPDGVNGVTAAQAREGGAGSNLRPRRDRLIGEVK